MKKTRKDIIDTLSSCNNLYLKDQGLYIAEDFVPLSLMLFLISGLKICKVSIVKDSSWVTFFCKDE